jgi:transposase
MKKDIITMSKKELERLPIIHKAMNKCLTQVKAAEMIGVCERQIRRIVEKIKKGGDRAIVHGNRGRASPFKMPEEKEKKIAGIIEKSYPDFGPTFAAEKLMERERIKISKEKLRQIMITYAIWHPKKGKRGKIHQWRERKHYRGEMLQMDGSNHDWLEGRGPKMDLIGYIDDATSDVYARFYKYEGTFSAMDSFRRYINKFGIPFSVYLDRHSTYKTTRQPNLDEELKGDYAKTQFVRALNEVGTKEISAYSPQAKGRIERTFETFQDRLIKEMRLAGIATLEEANAFLETYLPKYNARFAVKPIKRGNLHKSIPKNLKLDEIFCLKEYRTIGNSYTFQWKNRIFFIKNPSLTMKRQRVCIMEHFDGRITTRFNDKYLTIVEVTRKDLQAFAKEQKATQKLIRKYRVYYSPSKNHPWRRWSFTKKGNLAYV